MRVKRVRLKNGYKRFLDLVIDLGPSPARIVALVGPNGCGKSSVFDGMMFLHNQAVAQIGTIGVGQPDYHSMLGASTFTSHDSVELEFVTGAWTTVVQERSKLDTARQMFSFRSPYRFSGQVWMTEVKAVSPIQQNLSGATKAIDIDNKVADNYVRLWGKMTEYGNEKNLAPSDVREHVIGALNEALGRCLDLQISDAGNIYAAKGTLWFSKVDQPTPIRFDYLSAGEKEVIDILLDLYLRKETYTDTIFIFDEPELHINTAIQRKLLVEINSMVGGDCQIWIATHSIGLLRALQQDFSSECQIIPFASNAGYGSQAVTLEPALLSAKLWRELFSVALDDLAHLVSPRRMIYCEGRDLPSGQGEERGLDAQIYNAIFASSYTDTLFISSGGNTELDQRAAIGLLVLNKALPAVELLILKDRDFHSGHPATMADRNEYLAIHGKTHRMLERFELENYLFDPEIVRRFCELHGKEFDEHKYLALIPDIMNDHVKEMISFIKTACGLTENYPNDKFKKELAECITPPTIVYAALENVIFGIMDAAQSVDLVQLPLKP